MRLTPSLLFLFCSTSVADPAAYHVASDNTDVWFLGSVHYLRPQDHPLPGIVDDLYERADTLVMELDLDDIDPLAVQSSFTQAGILPDSTPLQSVIDATTYELAAARAAELGLPVSLLERLEPWLVALTLTDMGMSELGYQVTQGIEQYLLRRSDRDGKPIVGLESMDDQIGIFDALSWADQEALLLQTLRDLETPDGNMGRLIDAWRDGRLDALTEELSADFEDMPDLETALIGDRNRRWVIELEQLLREGGRYLVVVGALHLVGEDSVIDLLEERGLDVKRVTGP